VVGVEEGDAHRLHPGAVGQLEEVTAEPVAGVHRRDAPDLLGRRHRPHPVEDLAPDVPGGAQRLAAPDDRTEDSAGVGEGDPGLAGEAPAVLAGEVEHGRNIS